MGKEADAEKDGATSLPDGLEGEDNVGKYDTEEEALVEEAPTIIPPFVDSRHSNSAASCCTAAWVVAWEIW